MWIFKMVLWMILLLFLVFFAAENTQQEVQIQFWKWETQMLPLWLVMFLAFAAGVLVSLGVAILKVLQMNSATRRLKKENKKITNELNYLRSVSGGEGTSPSANKYQGGKDSGETLLLP